MHPLRRYFRDRTRSTADARQAIVLSAPSATEYAVELVDTGRTINAVVPKGLAALSAGQRVTVAPLGASGIGNGRYHIVSSHPLVQTSATPATSTKSAETVTLIAPEPVTLVNGGAAVEVLIYGVGLATAPTYGDAGITDDVAQVITATLITLHVKASGGMAAGRYSLTVAGVTISNFFEVTA